jgi:hypothetical protein
LAHGLHAVHGILVLSDLLVKGGLESVATSGHGFCTHSNTNVNAAHADLVGNVLYGFKTRGAESIYRGCSGGDWETGAEHSGTDFISGFAIADLV